MSHALILDLRTLKTLLIVTHNNNTIIPGVTFYRNYDDIRYRYSLCRVPPARFCECKRLYLGDVFTRT